MKIFKALSILPLFFTLTTYAATKELVMNPLITHGELPDFNAIKPAHFEPAIDSLLKSVKATVDQVTKEANPTWTNTLYVLDEESEKLDFATHTISHINSVHNVEEVRAAFEAILPKLSDFSTDLSQNKALYELYKKLKDGNEFASYSPAQKMIINNAIRDFKRSGIELDETKKARLKEINGKLSELSNNFSKNVIDATQAWTFHVTEAQKDRLQGLPENTIELARAKAQKDGDKGWVLTLDEPCYVAVMMHAKDRKMREEFYHAYNIRASKEAVAKQFDNTLIIDEIMALKNEKVGILGYKNYAEYSLVPKMANDTKEVMTFLEDLAHRSKPQATKELEKLKDFAKECDNITDFEPWDAGYYSTLYQKVHFNFSQEDLRPYFPEEKVFHGLFALVNRIYGVKIEEVTKFSGWDKSVKFFEVRDRAGNLRGKFYADLFARDFKNSGAWVAGLVSRMKRMDGSIQTPVGFLEANFRPASGDKPALLSHSEVVTLFHEFGHMMHALLTQVDYPGVAGTNVPWDAVELPSQFMENWSYEWEVVKDISGHYKTGDALPKAEFDKLIEVKNYNSALGMLRQLEFGIFDFRLHMRTGKDAHRTVQEILDDVRNEVAVIKPPAYNRFQNCFAHIFAGGYAAGYYGYKWAEVLSSDAFSKFEEDGLWNEGTGQLFLESILEQGGSHEPMELFIKFRGRKPKIDALLKANGIDG